MNNKILSNSVYMCVWYVLIKILCVRMCAEEKKTFSISSGPGLNRPKFQVKKLFPLHMYIISWCIPRRRWSIHAYSFLPHAIEKTNYHRSSTSILSFSFSLSLSLFLSIPAQLSSKSRTQRWKNPRSIDVFTYIQPDECPTITIILLLDR